MQKEANPLSKPNIHASLVCDVYLLCIITKVCVLPRYAPLAYLCIASFGPNEVCVMPTYAPLSYVCIASLGPNAALVIPL